MDIVLEAVLDVDDAMLSVMDEVMVDRLDDIVLEAVPDVDDAMLSVVDEVMVDRSDDIVALLGLVDDVLDTSLKLGVVDELRPLLEAALEYTTELVEIAVEIVPVVTLEAVLDTSNDVVGGNVVTLVVIEGVVGMLLYTVFEDVPGVSDELLRSVELVLGVSDEVAFTVVDDVLANRLMEEVLDSVELSLEDTGLILREAE